MACRNNKACVELTGALLSYPKESMLDNSVADAVLRTMPPLCDDLDGYLEWMLLNYLCKLVGVLCYKLSDLLCACRSDTSFLIKLIFAYP